MHCYTLTSLKIAATHCNAHCSTLHIHVCCLSSAYMCAISTIHSSLSSARMSALPVHVPSVGADKKTCGSCYVPHCHRLCCLLTDTEKLLQRTLKRVYHDSFTCVQ